MDLSKVVSKWIGETEKNLAALFDAAEAGHAVLLFDEADALFGKRTDVKSSNDRHANQEVNFLLQRLETFAGICILTTNHETAIDEAFRRRLSVHVKFPMPEAEERARLWEAMLPADAPREGDLAIDAAREAVLAELGQRKAVYEVAGTASAQASGGSRATQAKVRALIAALPIVESMTGLIKGMVASTAHQPTYDATAGIGLHMAAHAGRPQAANFVTTLGHLAFIHGRFQALDTEWSSRLRSLQQIRDQLGGVRPEGDKDLVKSVLGHAGDQSPNAGGGE